MGSYDASHLQELLAGLNGSKTLSAQFRHQSSLPVLPGLGLVGPEVQVETRGDIQVSQPSSTQALNSVQPVPSRNSTLVPDASTITTWPAALKFVTKFLITNERAATKIKHMITQQCQHEREWWAGREAVFLRQSNRPHNHEKARRLLMALGGTVAVASTGGDAGADREEVERYDKKVYSELVKMSADFDRQLRALNVPFFAIKHELVATGIGKEGLAISGSMDRGELRELQKKMLQTLEDLLMD